MPTRQPQPTDIGDPDTDGDDFDEDDEEDDEDEDGEDDEEEEEGWMVRLGGSPP